MQYAIVLKQSSSEQRQSPYKGIRRAPWLQAYIPKGPQILILDILVSDIISKGVYSQLELEEEELRDTTLNLWPITGPHSTTELCSLP